MAGEKLLSDRECKSAQARPGVYYLNDGAGLRLQVRPDGKKYWLFRYRLDGKESTHSLGAYPSVSLAAARVAATKARVQVVQGRSPTVAKRLERAQRIERDRATFKAVATEWLERHKPGWSEAHHERNEGLLRRILYPELGPVPIDEITEPMLLRVLKRAYDGGVKESARRARGVASQVFVYAKDTHRATHNPARELADSSVLRKPPVRSFAALPASQVGEMLRKLDESAARPAVRAALLLMLYTGLRDASLRAARWREVDLEGGIWTLPAERMKRREPHTVPLPKQAVAVLKSLAPLTDTGPGSFIFASDGKSGYVAENTLRVLLHRLGFKVTAHGVRSLLTDVLNEQGFNPDAIERQLHHVERNKVRAAYLRSDFFEYRRTMMQWWADWLDSQRAKDTVPALPENVVAFRRMA